MDIDIFIFHDQLYDNRGSQVKQRGGVRANIKCYGCQELGHYRDQCPECVGGQVANSNRGTRGNQGAGRGLTRKRVHSEEQEHE